MPPQDLIDLFVGSAHGDFGKVKELLAQHPDLLNASASWNETAIQAAAQVGRVDIAEFLLEHGAPQDICCATMLGKMDTVAAALRQDPTLANAHGAHGIGVLYHAIIRSHTAIAQQLLDHGATINAGAGGSPALHGAVMFNLPLMVTWLLERGADKDILNYEQKTPLQVAEAKGYAEVVAALQA